MKFKSIVHWQYCKHITSCSGCPDPKKISNINTLSRYFPAFILNLNHFVIDFLRHRTKKLTKINTYIYVLSAINKIWFFVVISLQVTVDIPYASPPQGMKYFTIIGPHIDCMDDIYLVSDRSSLIQVYKLIW